MKLNLRPYQEEAISNTYDYWASDRGKSPLIVAPTGSGKSLILSKIIQDFTSFGDRVLVLTHVKELIEQDAKEYAQLTGATDWGFYSASIGKKDLTKTVTFAGIQSVWQRAYDFIPAPDLVLIDEAHMVPKNTTTRYGKFLADLRVCNPNVKMVGLTATPYRLDSGYLHKGKDALFDGIAYDIPVSMLMDEGYLSPVISKGSTHKIDLTNVHMRGGEFIESELATAASDPELVRRTVAEIVELGAERKLWLVFSSGVGHAQLLEEEFKARGIATAVITGDTSNRGAIIDAYKRQDFQCLINVNVLTTGFNVPAVDLVAIVRATASTALYVQIVGRGTRISPGKENCLVLDYGQNVERHGFIDAVKPKINGESGGGESPTKECDQCQMMIHAALRICPGCGFEFPAPVLNHGTRAYSGALLTNQVQPEWVDVDDVAYAIHRKKDKPDSVKVSYMCGLVTINEWLCPDHGGYATSRYTSRKGALRATANTTAEAMQECESWVKPSRIKIKPRVEDPRYNEIVQLDYTPKAKGEELDWNVGWGKQEDLEDDFIPF